MVREQYADDALAARLALWRWRPGPTLDATIFGFAAVRGTELIVDVGCGNGGYLAELRRRGHTGPVLGLDLSMGMARCSRVYAPTAVADAQALPLPDRSVDIALSLHMLYHVPDLTRAVGELRRVVRPGGTALVATNGLGHTAEAKAVLAEAAKRVAGIDVDHDWDNRRLPPAVARSLLSAEFDDVHVHERSDSFPVPDRRIVSGYLASWPPESIGLHAGEVWNAILTAADELLAGHFARHGAFTITGRVAVLTCR